MRGKHFGRDLSVFRQIDFDLPHTQDHLHDLRIDGDIFGLLATQTPGHGGEIQLTDAIKRLLATKPVYGYVYPGKRQDIGNPQGYFKALEAFNGNGQG